MVFPKKRNIFKQFNVITLDPFSHISLNSITYLSLLNGMFSNDLAVIQLNCWYGGGSSGAVWIIFSEVRDKTLHLSISVPLC